MEYQFDWKGYQDLFYPRRKLSGIAPGEPSEPVRVVVHQKKILYIKGPGEDFGHWRGKDLSLLESTLENRKIEKYEAPFLDRQLADASALPNFAAQIQKLNLNARQHFLVDAIAGWWKKVFPSYFGLYVSLSSPDRQFLVVFRQGQIEAFFEPSHYILAKSGDLDIHERTELISDSYLMPVQGLFTQHQAWNDWVFSSQPFLEFFQSIKKNQTKVTPKRYGLSSLVLLKAYLGI